MNLQIVVITIVGQMKIDVNEHNDVKGTSRC